VYIECVSFTFRKNSEESLQFMYIGYGTRRPRYASHIIKYYSAKSNILCHNIDTANPNANRTSRYDLSYVESAVKL